MAEFKRLTVSIIRIADEIDTVTAALRNPGQDKNEPDYTNNLASKLDAVSTRLRQAVDDPSLEDDGTSSVDSANNDPDRQAAGLKKMRPLGTDTTTLARKPSEVTKGGELTNPANDDTKL